MDIVTIEKRSEMTSFNPALSTVALDMQHLELPVSESCSRLELLISKLKNRQPIAAPEQTCIEHRIDDRISKKQLAVLVI